MEYLMYGGATEVGSLSWDLSLAVGQKGQEKLEVAGEGNLLAPSTWLIWDCQPVVRVRACCVCCVLQGDV